MNNKPKQKYYWGIGLENETYMQFEESIVVSGTFIQEKIGCERYSIDYRKCYKDASFHVPVASAFEQTKKYQISRMMNSHSWDKIDKNWQHKTIFGTEPLADNPEYAGQSMIENFLETQPHPIRSMLTTKTNPMGSVNFDGDSIEFVTKYFENRTISDSCDELAATKKLFIDKINESAVLTEKLSFPKYNIGLNMFMSNQENIVLFNNGTYHFHITLPTLTENSRIVDYTDFERKHANAIYMLQWFEPLFIATLGSPDIMQVISAKNGLNTQFAGGSMRNAMSRYTGVGTFHNSMAKGKILTYPVEEFRKLLKFTQEDNIWWRDQIAANFDYELLSDVGLDFNQEKMYQSGFEFRSFDEFPATYLNDVLEAIIIVCEHALHVPNMPWGHDSVVWNNLVYKSLKLGYQTEITPEEKQEVLTVLSLSAYQSEFESIVMLDEFFFQIIAILHNTYKEHNTCIDKLLGEKSTSAPRWDNFNKFQTEQHLKQLEAL